MKSLELQNIVTAFKGTLSGSVLFTSDSTAKVDFTGEIVKLYHTGKDILPINEIIFKQNYVCQ